MYDTNDFILVYDINNDNVEVHIELEYKNIVDKLAKIDANHKIITSEKNKLTKELMSNNKELISNKYFLNFYYWGTSLSLNILGELVNKTNFYHYIKDFLKNNLIIITKCSNCNEIEYKIPTSRPDRDVTISDNKKTNFICKKCKQEELQQYLKKENNKQILKLKERDEIKHTIDELKHMPYSEYLQTKHWKDTRKRALHKAQYKCQLCSSTKNLEVHHNTYENRGNEKDEDLIVLCHDCHNNYHNPNNSSNKLDYQMLQELLNILHITKEDFKNNYIDPINKVNNFKNKIQNNFKDIYIPKDIQDHIDFGLMTKEDFFNRQVSASVEK